MNKLDCRLLDAYQEFFFDNDKTKLHEAINMTPMDPDILAYIDPKVLVTFFNKYKEDIEEYFIDREDELAVTLQDVLFKDTPAKEQLVIDIFYDLSWQIKENLD